MIKNGVFVVSQLIFRKVADVRREKELAEKRKNEPQLDEQRDQLVRKIFTKFRKDRAPSQVLGMQQATLTLAEENKTDGGTSSGTVADPSDGNGRPKVLPLVLRQQSEDQQATCSTALRPTAAPKKVSKWGKVLGGGSGGGSAESMDTSTAAASATGQQSHGVVAKARDSPGRVAGGNGHKVFPKLQKVPTTAEPFVAGNSGQRQETIDETDERQAGRVSSGAGGGQEPEEEPPPAQQQPASPQTRRTDAPSPPPPPCPSMLLPPPLDLDVLSKIEDMKTEFKADVQSINQRLTAIEDMMVRIFDKLDTLSASSVPSPLLQPHHHHHHHHPHHQQQQPVTSPVPPDTQMDVSRGCRTKSTDDLSSPMTPKLPPMVRRRRSKSRTRSSSSALPPMRPYSPRDTSPPPFPRSESLKKPCPPRPNDFL